MLAGVAIMNEKSSLAGGFLVTFVSTSPSQQQLKPSRTLDANDINSELDFNMQH